MADPTFLKTDEPDSVEQRAENETAAIESSWSVAQSGSPKPDYLRAYRFLLPLATGVLVLDQWTKSLVRTNLAVGDVWVPWSWMAPYARIVHWHNTGAAFGMFKDFGVVFTVLAILVAGAILYYFPHVPRQEWSLRLAMGFQLGGAVGNLTDRLMVGQVTDFISIGSFPVFNVADASISIGVAVLILGMWLSGRRDSEQAALKEVQPDSGETDPGVPGGRSDLATREVENDDREASLPDRGSP